MDNKQIILECKRVKFYTRYDEDVFFEWLKKIKCIKNVVGMRDKILLTVDEQLSNSAVMDLIGLFRRYKINMKQLDIFYNSSNQELLDGYKKSFSINVYPAKVQENS